MFCLQIQEHDDSPPPLHHAPLLTLRGAQPSGRVDEMNNVVRDLALGCVKVRERQKA